jgi:peptidoglycan/LPS O-acetylase OafA/YrhL
MSTLTTRAKVGYWLAVVLGVVDIASLFLPQQPDGEGPPWEVTVFSGVMGVITVAAAVWVARAGSRPALRIMAVSRILSGITALPAFFVPGVPPVFVAFGAAVVVLTIVAVVLLMSRARTPVPHGT